MILSLIDQDQYTYLKRKNIDCGIVNEIPDKMTSSRIINAKPSTNIYPWMAHIRHKIYKDEDFLDTKDKKYGLFDSAGAVISDKAIITCGHCICNNEEPIIGTPYIVTCIPDEENTDGSFQEANLNRKGINEIHVTLGQNYIGNIPRDFKFDNTIVVHFYKYEEDSGVADAHIDITNKNGDIGIIVRNSGFNLIKGKIAPICLPAPDSFNKKDGMNVKLAGWGIRQSKKKTTSGKFERLCLTNEGRESNQLHLRETNAKRSIFLPCQKRVLNDVFERNDFCIALEKSINTFSFRTKFSVDYKMASRIKSDKNYEKCVSYMKKGEAAWVNVNKFLHPGKTYKELKALFYNTIHWIEVREGDIKGSIIEICFNAQKLGENGICKTKEEKPFDWGFCSRSCHVSNVLGRNEPYEEAEFVFFDTAPKGSYFSGK